MYTKADYRKLSCCATYSYGAKKDKNGWIYEPDQSEPHLMVIELRK